MAALGLSQRRRMEVVGAAGEFRRHLLDVSACSPSPPSWRSMMRLSPNAYRGDGRARAHRVDIASSVLARPGGGGRSPPGSGWSCPRPTWSRATWSASSTSTRRRPPPATSASGCARLASLAYLWPRTRSRRWDHLAACVGRGRRGLLRRHPGHRLDLGPGLVGGVVDLGCPPDPDRSAAGRVRRATWPCAGPAVTPTPGPSGARSSAVLCALVVPVDHEATNWWQTLHQGDTLLRANPLIHGWQLVEHARCRSSPTA